MKGVVASVTNDRTLGHEGVGIIEETGNGVTNFKQVIMYSFPVLLPAGNVIIVKWHLFTLRKRRLDIRHLNCASLFSHLLDALLTLAYMVKRSATPATLMVKKYSYHYMPCEYGYQPLLFKNVQSKKLDAKKLSLII